MLRAKERSSRHVDLRLRKTQASVRQVFDPQALISGAVASVVIHRDRGRPVIETDRENKGGVIEHQVYDGPECVFLLQYLPHGAVSMLPRESGIRVRVAEGVLMHGCFDRTIETRYDVYWIVRKKDS